MALTYNYYFLIVLVLKVLAYSLLQIQSIGLKDQIKVVGNQITKYILDSLLWLVTRNFYFDIFLPILFYETGTKNQFHLK